MPEGGGRRKGFSLVQASRDNIGRGDVISNLCVKDVPEIEGEKSRKENLCQTHHRL